MKTSVVLILLLTSLFSHAQEEQVKQLRAFPITGYIVDLDDSTRVVQVRLPVGLTIAEKQLGIIRGVYRDKHSDTAFKGFGKCRLIKEDYFYFSISGNKSGIALQEGDLLYTFMPGEGSFDGNITGIAAHFIELQDVYDQPFYDPYQVFSDWTAEVESSVLDTMVKDIRFTGNYFTNNDPSVDKDISSGDYSGQKVLQVMTRCNVNDLVAFMEYVRARPLLYAGRKWKLSEVFATWLAEGAPTVIRKKSQ